MNKFEIYNRAADILKECGWTQNEYTDGNGYCAVGAIAAAMREMGKEPSDMTGTMEHYVETKLIQVEGACSDLSADGRKTILASLDNASK